MDSQLFYGFESLPQAFAAVATGSSRALVTMAIRPDSSGEVLRGLIELGQAQGYSPELIHADEIDRFFATSAPVSRSSTIRMPSILGRRSLLLIDGVSSCAEETRDKVFRFLFRGDSLNYVTVITLSHQAAMPSLDSLKADFPLSSFWFSRRID